MNKKLISALVLTAIVAMPVIAIAQSDFEDPPTGVTTWTQVRGAVLRVVYSIAGLIVVISLIIAGVLFATAGGDDDKLKSARSALIWGVAGIVVVLIATGLWSVIQSALGVQ